MKGQILDHYGLTGQAIVEFAVICVPLLMLMLTVIDLGIMYERRITMINAVRDGTRYATIHPTAWDPSPTPAFGSIEGAIRAESTDLPNDDSHLTIVYSMVRSDGSLDPCGRYTVSGGWQNTNGHSRFSSGGDCVQAGNLITIQATNSYPLLSPFLQMFRDDLQITTSASMLEEV